MPVSGSLTEPLNPDVYLNYLSPTDGHNLEIGRNITLFIFGATLWDVLVYVPVDIKIVWRSRFRFVVCCFASSRLLALIHVLIISMKKGFPTNHWASLPMYIISVCACILSMTTSSFLFLQRVLAIYHGEKWVRRCFCLLWVIYLSSFITMVFGGHPTQIPGTNYYKDDDIKPWAAVGAWLIFFFDTAVLLAISYKIALSPSTVLATQGVSWFDLLSGRTLPRLSRSIFRGGQQYYLITVGTTLAGIAVCLPSVPQIYKALLPTALVSLTASMACRVFRNTKLFDFNTTFTAAETRVVV